MKKSLIKKYAELIAHSGVAIRKGQDVVINADVNQEKFVAMLVEACYKEGARVVEVRWSSLSCAKVAYRKASQKALSEVTPVQIARAERDCDRLPAMIHILSTDPDGMKGVNPKKAAEIRKAQMKVLHPYRVKMDNHYQWCIAAVPSPEWAKKVFPNLSKAKAVEALWEAILKVSRADDGNGIANWEAHDKDLKKRCAYLNSLRLKKLHYTSENGTDLTVGLIPGVIFLGGGEKNIEGDYYQPNIPSEECFTSPRKGEAEGIVYAAKPLSYNGQLIQNFWIRFENGKAVDCHAEVGEETLRSILTLDEGAAYLGECALVPYDSPINNTGLLFYETLFDENAACHLALGRGFTMLYPGYENMSEDELYEAGINRSISHVDFMIGSKDLRIVGTTEKGEEIEIFRDGNWAF